MKRDPAERAERRRKLREQGIECKSEDEMDPLIYSADEGEN